MSEYDQETFNNKKFNNKKNKIKKTNFKKIIHPPTSNPFHRRQPPYIPPYKGLSRRPRNIFYPFEIMVIFKGNPPLEGNPHIRNFDGPNGPSAALCGGVVITNKNHHD